MVTVPTAAIQRGAPGAYVYVINADSTVSVRPVKHRPDRRSDGCASTSGLSAGDRVVVDGTDRLRDGARVSVAGQRRSRGAAARHGGMPRQRRPVIRAAEPAPVRAPAQ